MKKLLVCTLLVVSSAAMANSATSDAATMSYQKGGYSGPNNVAVDTVANALEAKDESSAVLTGYIIESIGDEEYRFQDTSGEIIVEIDSDNWNGINATPDTKLVLKGEVENDWSSRSVEIDSVHLAE